jgi:hypothetical protein
VIIKYALSDLFIRNKQTKVRKDQTGLECLHVIITKSIAGTINDIKSYLDGKFFKDCM